MRRPLQPPSFLQFLAVTPCERVQHSVERDNPAVDRRTGRISCPRPLCRRLTDRPTQAAQRSLHMAEETPATQQNAATPSTEDGPGAKAAAPTAAQAPSKADESVRFASRADKDPMRELLEHLERAQPVIANLDRNLAQTIQVLTQQGADPERRAQPAFRHRSPTRYRTWKRCRSGRSRSRPISDRRSRVLQQRRPGWKTNIC
jgi:hypothetical protein